MAETIPTLTQFNLAESDEGYLLEIGASDGAVVRVAASAEQIDAIIQALDALISEEDDGVEEPDSAD